MVPEMRAAAHTVELHVDRYGDAQAVCYQCGHSSLLVRYDSDFEMVLLNLWVDQHHWQVGAEVVRAPDMLAQQPWQPEPPTNMVDKVGYIRGGVYGM